MRRYKGTPVPEEQHRLSPEDILRAFVIGAVILVGGFVLGNFTFSQIHGRGTAYFVLAAGVGILLTAVAYQRLEWVMAAFLVVAWLSIGSTPSMATGVSSGTGKGLALSQIGIAFLLVMWVVRSALRGRFSFIRSPLNVLLILYLIYNVWSAVNGILFWDPRVAHFYGPELNGGRPVLAVVILELGIRVLSIGAFWLFANNLHDEAWLRRMSWLILLPGVLIICTYLFHLHLPLNSYSLLLEGTATCTLFAWLLEPHLPTAPDRRRLRAAGWVALLVIIVMSGVIALKWVSAGLNLFGGLYYIAFMRSKKLFFAMIVGGVLLYVGGHGFLEATVFHKVETSGDLYRVSMVQAAFLYAMRFPLGVGPGNYRSYNGYYGSPAVWNTSTFTSAHDFYAQMLSEMGFGGLLISVAFVLTALVLLARFYRQLPPGWSRVVILGIGGMWAGLCLSTSIGDYIIPVYYNGGVHTMATTIYGWIGLGVAFAHARRCGLLSDQPKPAAAEQPVPPSASYYPQRMGRDITRN